MESRTKKHGLGSEAYQKLRRLLIHGQLRSGVKLIESEWAKRLGVHRIAMREAMVLLAHEGLLKPGPRGGFYTPLLERRDLDELVEVRTLIEIGALRLIASRGGVGPQDVTRLESVCDLMRANVDAGMELGAIESDREFHRALVEIAGNARLLALYSHASLPVLPSQLTDAEERRTDGMRTIAEHRRIIALIAAGRVDEAVELLARHLEASCPSLPPEGDGKRNGNGEHARATAVAGERD